MHAIQHVERHEKTEKETIHSGHFMVSHFEAEEQDDEDNVAVPIPEVTDSKAIVVSDHFVKGITDYINNASPQQQIVEIDNSLSKLFQCMSLAYRQKLTSPKWNRFRGIRLRWKDKIRLNNVIWRCWHLQFIKKNNTIICQFASPLDVDTHNKPEAVVLEGKYWKRKLAAVTAEYKKWRMFYRHHALGYTVKDQPEPLGGVDLLVWDSNSSDNMHMMVDEDYMGLMSDTLFSTISHPFAFPDSREIARAGLADFIQPGLEPLQPNLDDYMDTFDPIQEFMTSKLPTVPEEQNQEQLYKQNTSWSCFIDSNTSAANVQAQNTNNPEIQNQFNQYQSLDKVSDMDKSVQHSLHTTYNEMMLEQQVDHYVTHALDMPFLPPPPPYHSSVKSSKASPPSSAKQLPPPRGGKLNHTSLQQQSGMYNKSMESIYSNYSQPQNSVVINDSNRIQVPQQQTQVQQQQQQQFKLPQTQEFKFTTPGARNALYVSQVPYHMQQHNTVPSHSQYSNSSHSISLKDEKPEPRRRGAPRGRQRSRSNTREPIKRPPLVSAVSDPALLPPPQQASGSVLLTQLLTNSTENQQIYHRSHSMNATISQDPLQVKEENSPVAILPQPPPTPTAILIPAQIGTVITTSSTDPLMLNTFSNSNSPIMDPSSTNLHSPTSSQGSIGSPNRDNTSHSRDRRVGHIHAEQKRRYNIKNGFDMIHSLIPHLNQNPNTRLSKASMLHKGAEYIRQLHSERNQLKEEMDCLRQQIESLNNSISNCQSMLPATGAPMSRRRDSKMQEMFDEYVRARTMENWKFWIFSLIFRPFLNSFNNFVSTASLEDLYATTMAWIEQHCTLGDLRPVVPNSLRRLCAKTNFLMEPEKLPEEAREIVMSNNQST